jgi:polar amino acid transport system substrate-binding protein
MNKKVTQNLIVLALMAAFAVSGCSKSEDETPDYAQEMKSITCLTEHYPPFNFEHEGGIYGVSVDMLAGLMEKIGLSSGDISIEVDEWDVMYQRTLNDENTMLFSTIRIPERENLFKWVGPIAPQKDVIITLASHQIEISNVSELAAYQTGVIQGYSNIQQLLDAGVPSGGLTEMNSLSSLYEALENGTVDCIAFSEIGHGLYVSSEGYDPDYFDIVFTLDVAQLYFAFNNSTSDQLIDYLQTTFDQFKLDKTADGSSVYEKILNNYQVIQYGEDNITEQMAIDLVNITAMHLEDDLPSTVIKINNGESPYKNAENPALYAFLYDTSIDMVAHATNPLLVGENFKGKTDAAGKPFRDEIVNGALANGEGWEDYIYTKPDQSGLYYKTTYYKLITGSDGEHYIVCSGKYK